mmetsp:Transcript_15130/g.37703  ORF Transcript_15130/g.37703 Transcript_15130/m.37703 type:complete len:249 (-) Transcript_15130:241-987(-)
MSNESGARPATTVHVKLICSLNTTNTIAQPRQPESIQAMGHPAECITASLTHAPKSTCQVATGPSAPRCPPPAPSQLQTSATATSTLASLWLFRVPALRPNSGSPSGAVRAPLEQPGTNHACVRVRAPVTGCAPWSPSLPARCRPALLHVVHDLDDLRGRQQALGAQRGARRVLGDEHHRGQALDPELRRQHRVLVHVHLEHLDAVAQRLGHLLQLLGQQQARPAPSCKEVHDQGAITVLNLQLQLLS